MRIPLIGSVTIILTVLGLGISAATARVATQLEEHNNYSGCYCQFGYGSNPCGDSVECASEGGRCVRACVMPRNAAERKPPTVPK
jgi:hypothetical protein